MAHAKVAISIEQTLLKRVDRLVKAKAFGSRSEAFQTAISEKMSKLDKTRLAVESAKLDRRKEQLLAEEGLLEDVKEWPDY